MIAGHVAHNDIRINREHGDVLPRPRRRHPSLRVSSAVPRLLANQMPRWTASARSSAPPYSNTRSIVSSTTRRVPASQCRRCRMDLGKITCSLVESLIVNNHENVTGILSKFDITMMPVTTRGQLGLSRKQIPNLTLHSVLRAFCSYRENYHKNGVSPSRYISDGWLRNFLFEVPKKSRQRTRGI
jgi:hypothetical protein